MRHCARMIVWLALLLAACGPITAPAEPSPSPIPPSVAGVTPTQVELHTRLPTASAPPSAVPQPTPTLEPTATPAPAAHTLIVTNSAGYDNLINRSAERDGDPDRSRRCAVGAGTRAQPDRPMSRPPRVWP